MFFILALNACIAFAQEGTIKGKVAENVDNETLIGATVTLEDGTGTVTDLDGNYTLKTSAGSHTLTIKYIGYQDVTKSVKVKAGETVTINVLLQEAATQLDFVVVSASQYEKNIAEETVSMDILDAKLIENNNATELGEAVDKSVGVQVQEGQISIRGGSSYSYGVGSRTAVMVDNVSFTSADLGEAQLKQVPLENVEQVEVIKGASSVVYGSSALNGVVNVITSWPKSETPQQELTVFQGIYDNPKRDELRWWSKGSTPGFSGISYSIGQKKGNFDVVGGANVNYVNNFLELADEFRVRASFKTRYRSKKVEGLNFGVNGSLNRENSERFFIASDLDSGAYLNGSPSSDQYWKWNVDPHLTYINGKGSTHRFRSRWLNVFRIGSSTTPNANSNALYAEYQYQKNWNDRFVLTAGLPVSFGFSSSNLYEGTRINYTGAGYTQAEFKTRKVSLVGGVRYEISAVDSLTETTIPVFRTGINYQPAPFTFIRSSWGQAYRLPSIGERFIDAEFSLARIVPNPALQPESGWGYEFGIKQGLKISKWMGYFDFSLFWSEYTNFVEYNADVFPPDGWEGNIPFDSLFAWLGLQANNVGLARVAGYEASLIGKGDIGPVQFRTLMGYTYTFPVNLEADSSLRDIGTYLKEAVNYMDKRVPDSLSNFLLNYRVRHLVKGDIEFKYKRFMLGYTIYYGSFPEKVDPLFTFAIKNLTKFIDEHQEGDIVMGMRAGVDISDKFRIAFLVKNLTNHEYSSRPGRIDPPRSFTLQLKFNM